MVAKVVVEGCRIEPAGLQGFKQVGRMALGIKPVKVLHLQIGKRLLRFGIIDFDEYATQVEDNVADMSIFALPNPERVPGL